jgi:hypothetical protein
MSTRKVEGPGVTGGRVDERQEWTLEPLNPTKRSTPLASSGPNLLPGQRVAVVSKGLYQAQVEANVAQREELDVALRQRAEAERARDAKQREAESLVWEMGKQKAAAESRAEAAEAERDDLRRRVGELERTLIGELCGDKTCARCSKFRAALARETSPAGEGDN